MLDLPRLVRRASVVPGRWYERRFRYSEAGQPVAIEERGFSVAEAKAAREAFISSATTIAMPVVEIDGTPVANGNPGSVVHSLRRAFFDVAEKTPA